MANIGKKGLEVPKIPGKKGDREASSGGQTTGMTGDQKFTLLMAVLTGVVIACILAMIAMLGSWWQFASNSFNDYSKVIREYNDKRYEILNNRIQQLEIKITTDSAKGL